MIIHLCELNVPDEIANRYICKEVWYADKILIILIDLYKEDEVFLKLRGTHIGIIPVEKIAPKLLNALTRSFHNLNYTVY